MVLVEELYQLTLLGFTIILCNVGKILAQNVWTETPVGGAGNGFTVTDIVAVLAHRPVSGVKVYNVVAVLSNAGDQVPVMFSIEFVGNVGAVAP